MNEGHPIPKKGGFMFLSYTDVVLIRSIPLSTGDMVAGEKAGLNYQAMRDSFHEVVTLPLAESGIPFAVTISSSENYPLFYFKIYLENDFYGNHVDSSPSNLTFLYQFTSEKSNIHFPALEFEDGTQIPFESNQLIIFHSSRPHAFEKMQKVSDPNVYKCLVQCLPDFL